MPLATHRLVWLQHPSIDEEHAKASSTFQPMPTLNAAFKISDTGTNEATEKLEDFLFKLLNKRKKTITHIETMKKSFVFFSVHECIVLNVEWISLGEFTSKQEICMFKYYIISQGLHFLLAVELCHRSMPWWHKERKWCDFWCFYIFHMTDKTTPEMMRFVIGFCSCGHQKVFKLIIPN